MYSFAMFSNFAQNSDKFFLCISMLSSSRCLRFGCRPFPFRLGAVPKVAYILADFVSKTGTRDLPLGICTLCFINIVDNELYILCECFPALNTLVESFLGTSVSTSGRWHPRPQVLSVTLKTPVTENNTPFLGNLQGSCSDLSLPQKYSNLFGVTLLNVGLIAPKCTCDIMQFSKRKR